jgi:stage III sporulation protein AH
MKMDNLKRKVTELCRKVGRRNFIIMGAVLLTAVAVGVNLVMFASNRDDGYDYDQSAGMDAGTADTSGGTSTGTQQTSDSYFSSIQVNRQRTRDEAIEVLQAVVDNESSTETAKNEALAQISKLADIMEAESNIETLIVAKGFEECVAVISDDKVSIVVKSEGLQAAQISQINEIVYEQCGIKPVNVNIIER